MSADLTLGVDAASASLRKAGITSAMLDAPAMARVNTYFALRGDWSRTHNLAGPRALRDPWRVDLVDACALASVIHKNMALVDVGSGSGTPGLLVGCLRPEHPIILVEPIAKRTAFLRAAISKLGLQNVRVYRGRWPIDVSHETYQIVSRAVVAPEAWPKLALRGEPRPSVIIRMLGQKKPAFNLQSFVLDQRLDYHCEANGDRCIEVWADARRAG